MTVWELKKMLEDYDEGLEIVIPWYEWGYDDADDVSEIHAQEDNASENWDIMRWYEWRYSKYDPDEWYKPIKKVFIS